MQKKKKQWLKMAGYFLMIPLFLYGSLCLFFYLEKRKDPVLSYRMSFDSDRSPAQFKVNEQGNRVYIDQADSNSYEADTEAAACWDCYKGSWSEEFRKALGRWLPSGLRMKGHGRVVNCAAGALQAAIDIGGGAVLITGGTVAYLGQFLDVNNIALQEHRESQLEYAFYFVRDGTVFKVMSDGVKKLIRHIAKSIKTGDNYALCEMATVFASLSLFPKARTRRLEDRDKIATKEQNILNSFDNELARLDSVIAKAQKKYDVAVEELKRGGVVKSADETTAKKVEVGEKAKSATSDPGKLYPGETKVVAQGNGGTTKPAKVDEKTTGKNKEKSDSATAQKEDAVIEIPLSPGAGKRTTDVAKEKGPATSQNPSSVAESATTQKAPSGVTEAMKQKQAQDRSLEKQRVAEARDAKKQKEIESLGKEIEVLREQRRIHLQTGKRGYLQAKAIRKLISTAKSPWYFLQAVKDEALTFVPTSAKNLFIKPGWATAETTVKYAPYLAGRTLKEPGEVTLQDYVDSLGLDKVSP